MSASELAALDAAIARRPVDAQYADLVLLVNAVRDDAPRLDPGFEARLEERIAQGFETRPAPVRKRRALRLWHRPWLPALAAAALALLIAGAAVISRQPGIGGARRAAGTITKTATPPQPGEAVHAEPAVAAPATARTAHAAPSAPQAARQVEQEATLALLAPRGQTQHVADRVIAVSDSFGAVVANSNVSTDDQGGSSASFQLQIPAAQLEGALAALSGLAHVSSRTQGTQDVTDAYAAAQRRLADARAERQALLRQLAKATAPEQVASIHIQLGLAGGRIAAAAEALRSLGRRIDYVPLSVTISEAQRRPVPVAGGGSPSTLSRALGDARDVLEVSLAVALIVLAALVPLALAALAAWHATRTWRRWRREQALDV
jgi:hypothetical protein